MNFVARVCPGIFDDLRYTDARYIACPSCGGTHVYPSTAEEPADPRPNRAERRRRARRR